MVPETDASIPFPVLEVASALSDQDFSRRAMRLGMERLGLTLDELLRRASPEKAAA